MKTTELIEKTLGEKGPFIEKTHSAKSCLVGLLESDSQLYERCLDAPGFAFWFSQLVNRAIKYDEAPTLARRLQKAIEQTETLLDMAYCATPSKSELAAELDAIE